MIAEKPISSRQKKEPVEILQNEKHDSYSEERAHRRTKQAIYDIVFNHSWQYFVTVTFDKEKVNRYDYDEVRKKYSQMLKDIKKRKCPDLEYLFVPELHKDGALHFHGLIYGADDLKLINSGLKDRSNRVIFNCPEFNLGFNTFTRIGDPAKASTYITKYISKELCYRLPGKKYWASRGHERVEEEKIYIGNPMQKKSLIEDLLACENLASYHVKEIDINDFNNTYTYIVTHEGAMRDSSLSSHK